MLRRLTRLVDDGRLAGHADVEELRTFNPKYAASKSVLRAYTAVLAKSWDPLG